MKLGSTRQIPMVQRPTLRLAALGCLAVSVISWVACSREKPEEPAVAVKAAIVQKTEIQKIVAADAVLFPLAQAALVPKINAPVRKYYVNRGSKDYHWQEVRAVDAKDREQTKADSRINSFAVGSEVEARSGTLVQKRIITSPQPARRRNRPSPIDERSPDRIRD